MASRNLQVRLEEEDLLQMDELAEETNLVRSEVARQALRTGMKRLRLERALMKHLNHEFTLARAAEYAGVGIFEMSQVAAERGIPYFRYPAHELERDAAVARKILKRR
ncbi:MAG TPA: UPF0175 family protein [Thermoplasmata archaeon]|nr:UPF0175 family protein [Thermoplasmata archaeon]